MHQVETDITCRREYTIPWCVEKRNNVKPPKRKLRSSNVAFNFEERCLFCLQGESILVKRT